MTPAARRPDAAPTVLAARAATKAYADLVALAPLTLTIRAGERVALVGHNGSGKSTFLRLAAGMLDLSGGEIEVSGGPVGSPEARAATSFIPDNPVLYDDLSVREHLAYIASLHGVDATEEELDRLVEVGRPGAPGRRPARPVQPRAAAEGGDRGGARATVLVAAGGRALRRPRRSRP